MIKIFCDGGSRGNPGPAASAFVAVDKDGRVLVRKGEYIGISTNNIAEYTAVIEALTWLVKQKIKDTTLVQVDSQLIANQLLGFYKIKNKNLALLAIKVKKLEKDFLGKISYKYIPRSMNKIADTLVNQTLDLKN